MVDSEVGRVGLGRRYCATVIRNAMRPRWECGMADENCWNASCNYCEKILHVAGHYISQHATFDRKWSIAAGEKLVLDIFDILRKSARQNLRFKGPHDPFVCAENERQVILGRLSRRRTPSLPLIWAMLNHEWLKPGHDLVDSLLQHLGYLALEIVDWRRKIDSDKFSSEPIVTLPDQLQQLHRCRLLASAKASNKLSWVRPKQLADSFADFQLFGTSTRGSRNTSDHVRRSRAISSPS